MAKPLQADKLFEGRHFDREVIILLTCPEFCEQFLLEDGLGLDGELGAMLLP